MRYFRATAETCEYINAQLDSAYGFPNPETKTTRTLPPASTLPRDEQGRVYLAVKSRYCEYILPSQMLPNLIESGDIEEIDKQDYEAVLPPAGGVVEPPPPLP